VASHRHAATGPRGHGTRAPTPRLLPFPDRHRSPKCVVEKPVSGGGRPEAAGPPTPTDLEMLCAARLRLAPRPALHDARVPRSPLRSPRLAPGCRPFALPPGLGLWIPRRRSVPNLWPPPPTWDLDAPRAAPGCVTARVSGLCWPCAHASVLEPPAQLWDQGHHSVSTPLPAPAAAPALQPAAAARAPLLCEHSLSPAQVARPGQCTRGAVLPAGGRRGPSLPIGGGT
jgi:hypothetical protein